MDAKRFFPISYDSRNHPKVRMLRMRGDGIAEYGRYIALLSILYDMGNRIDATDETMLAYLADELGLQGTDGAKEWIRLAASCGLLDIRSLEEFGIVCNNSVGVQLDYMAKCAADGRKGGRQKKTADK